ncbi:MAG: hypothetical protein ACKOF3_05335 [Spartobacteria bacterium]
MNSSSIEIARLMPLLAPHVFRSPDFAMKGGTALNLFSEDKKISNLYEEQFVGMTTQPVSLAELQEARSKLRTALLANLQDRHKKFLLGLVRLKPDWNLMPFPHLRDLPDLKWKILNLEKLKRTNPKKFALQSTELAMHFGR